MSSGDEEFRDAQSLVQAPRTRWLMATVAAAGLSLAGAANAQTMSVNFGAVTDYVARGVSQTNEGGALQGGADLTMGAGYFGIWASTVDFGNGTDTEVDIYAGFKPTWMGLTLDIGAIAYRYIGQPDDANLGYYEIKGAVSYALEFATVGAAIYWSPNFTGTDSLQATYYEINAAMPLPVVANLSLTGAYGRQTIEGPGDYNTWNAGLNWAPIPWLALDGRYWDTDEHGLGDNYGERLVGGIKATFAF
jgi:uncharacterized protein (TIGR02001 family)